MRIGERSSIFTYTRHFNKATHKIQEYPLDAVTVDGGPHILWWSVQSPDGSWPVEDIPAVQIIRELQPFAKFLVTLSDPVKRMYSDYYFLGDNLKPMAINMKNGEDQELEPKTAQNFHNRVLRQVEEFKMCVESTVSDMKAHGITGAGNADSLVLQYEEGGVIWFRASQMCAHDRHRFGVGGSGRLSIGLYVLFLEKWIEHFAPEQFLVMRMEDYDKNPKEHLNRIFNHLGLAVPSVWDRILEDKVFNENRFSRYVAQLLR
jgi:hypothetical protein